MAKNSKSGISIAVNENGISKQSIRQRIWRHLEESNLATFPRPVYNRIPNFKGSNQACMKAAELACYRAAKVVKVNPDKPQEHLRLLSLQDRKVLLVPTPRLRSGLFNRIIPPQPTTHWVLKKCATSQGVREFSEPIGLLDTAKYHVDVIIIGSVAVSKEGHRIGKGEGFADLEFAMMAAMGAVTPETMVITTVHDCQVFDELPRHLFGKNDVPVDFIVTPTESYEVKNRLPKPSGVYWEILHPQKFLEIPILRQFREWDKQ
ncbi:unnamed protein product [Darwinula stevensoni]|uniref:Methenyltetrahydrofolate synthase domain-containing protein n=1 Tax=Darwinula stevensoni TaxID=69355 RepID=A0A7R8XD78_9CRUS|nr:unnamed protein product [Darwinula stevensoni]CAG0893225.1 unnamed protein product [Darwinula stevensoni]